MFAPHMLHRLAGSLLLLSLCAGMIGCGSVSNAALSPPADGPAFSAHSLTPTGTPTPATGPQRLIIPTIGVNAPIENVGILPSGDLQTPSKSPWKDTGWYDGGPEPGQQGSAVIDGHLDQPGGYPAVFWFLHNLKIGNTVEIVGSTGQTLNFRVTDIEYYPPQGAPLQLIFGNSGGKYLNLITCAGDWLPSEKQTTLRLVVYTTLE